MTDDRSKGLLKNKSFWVRTGSAIIFAAIFVTVMVLGGYFTWAFLLLISLIGLYEFNRAM